MKFEKVIFTESVEAPGALSKVAYLQTTDPNRRDCIVRSIEAHEHGVLVDGELYPWAIVRRATLATAEHLEGIPWATDEQPKRRGRPPKQNDPA